MSGSRPFNCESNSNCTNRLPISLRSIEEVPLPYRSIFTDFHCFNLIQSSVLDEVFYSDKSIVISAPTGSGKTVLFELAIIRCLISHEHIEQANNFRIVYVSPMKALCEERLIDWHRKFAKFGLNCISATGDNDNADLYSLLNHNLIITTPEKWDSLTRKWQDNKLLVQTVKLFLIDEVHLLNEEVRGPTLEVVVCRMKTINSKSIREIDENDRTINIDDNKSQLRFIALSATIPNIEDVAEWIGTDTQYYKFSEDFRPVKLKKIVIGYPYNATTSTMFKFDLALSYKLQNLIMEHSEGKPTLIFCSTRKQVEMTATHVLQSITISLNQEQRKRLMIVVQNIVTDTKLRGMLVHGVGYHHAGMMPETRRTIETLFRNGDLAVLVTTSTLAMGVNLPAHLVIIKSTKTYCKGEFRDYTETALMQMIGRAGRPQFDSSATVLILTTLKDKIKFERMVNGGQAIESNLHRHLIEHINAEIVLQTITALDVAIKWLSTTFLYVRARKCPKNYGIPCGLSKAQIDRHLLDMCQIEINKLVKHGMITIDDYVNITPTNTGNLMAKYYLTFETVKRFKEVSGYEILPQILTLICKCGEFSEMYLRTEDKKALNAFNQSGNHGRPSYRFSFGERIKNVEMKINCIVQAVFGCLELDQQSLMSEQLKVMRYGERLSKGLLEFVVSEPNAYRALLSTIILSKCFQAKLWENSPHVARQLPGVGSVISAQMVKAGKTTFYAIMNSNPKELEIICNKKPPFGSTLIECIQTLPKYELKIVKENRNLNTTVSLINADDLKTSSLVDLNSSMHLLIGDSTNRILLHKKFTHKYMVENGIVSKNLEITDVNGQSIQEIETHFISENWVGFDCYSKLVLDNIQRPQKFHEEMKINKKEAKPSAPYMQKFIDAYMKSTKKIDNKIPQPLGNQINQEQKMFESTNASRLNNTFTIGSGTETFNVQSENSAKAQKQSENNSIRIISDETVPLFNSSIVIRNKANNINNSSSNNNKDGTTKKRVQQIKIDDMQLLIPMRKTAKLVTSPPMNQSNENNMLTQFNSNNNDNILNETYKIVEASYNVNANLNNSIGPNNNYNFIGNEMATSRMCNDLRPNYNPESEAVKNLNLSQFRYCTPNKLSHDEGLSQNHQFGTGMNASFSLNHTQNVIKDPKTFVSNTNDSKVLSRSVPRLNQNVKWRSPLVHSPPTKFSPKINCTITQDSSKNNTVQSVYYENNVSGSSSVKDSQSAMTAYKSTPLSRRSLPLRDVDFENFNNTEFFLPPRRKITVQSQKAETDKLSDVFSTSFMENMGLIHPEQNRINNEPAILNQSIRKSGVSKPVTIPKTVLNTPLNQSSLYNRNPIDSRYDFRSIHLVNRENDLNQIQNTSSPYDNTSALDSFETNSNVYINRPNPKKVTVKNTENWQTNYNVPSQINNTNNKIYENHNESLNRSQYLSASQYDFNHANCMVRNNSSQRLQKAFNQSQLFNINNAESMVQNFPESNQNYCMSSFINNSATPQTTDFIDSKSRSVFGSNRRTAGENDFWKNFEFNTKNYNESEMFINNINNGNNMEEVDVPTTDLSSDIASECMETYGFENTKGFDENVFINNRSGVTTRNDDRYYHVGNNEQFGYVKAQRDFDSHPNFRNMNFLRNNDAMVNSCGPPNSMQSNQLFSNGQIMNTFLSSLPKRQNSQQF